VRIACTSCGGNPSTTSRDGSDGTVGSHLREQEALLSRPTWWEWTQLEEWGYSDGLSAGGSNSYRAEQVEYPDLERMGLSDSEGETHSDVDHGGGSSSGSTSLAKREC
jgi:hypothetical protein